MKLFNVIIQTFICFVYKLKKIIIIMFLFWKERSILQNDNVIQGKDKITSKIMFTLATLCHDKMTILDPLIKNDVQNFLICIG